MKVRKIKNGGFKLSAQSEADSLVLYKFLVGPNPTPEQAAHIKMKEAELQLQNESNEKI